MHVGQFKQFAAYNKWANARLYAAALDLWAIADPALRLFPSEGKCDFVVDWAADPTWGPDSAAANQALYPDGTHPSQGGQSNMEANYFRPTLNSLFPLT